jgi:hypothetical protein
MTYEKAKKIVDTLIDALIIKETDRNIVMDLLMNIENE